MIFKNPLALVTIPLALALSIIWFRRKKLCDTGGDDQNSSSANTSEETTNKQQQLNQQNTEQSKRSSNRNHRDFTHSISVPTGGSSTPLKKSATTTSTTGALNNNEFSDFKFGKSAPIDITPHKTSPTRSKHGSNDSDASNGTTTAAAAGGETVTTKNDGLDFKLNSIEESSLDSVDLPGSITCRRRFSFTIRTNEPPIVVKASAMDAKDVNRSPQSSFEALNSTSPPMSAPQPTKPQLQSTSGASTMKSANPKTPSSKGAPARSSVNVPAPKSTPNKAKTEKPSKFEKKSATNTSTTKTNGEKDAAKKSSLSSTSSVSSGASSNNNVRVLPVASPPLSLCSNKSNQSHDSGDSGKGSSPATSEGGSTLSSLQSYDFELHHALVGFLVGKGGATVRHIRDECKVTISIKRHPTKFRKFKLCSVYGTQQQIDAAMAMIKSKMPPKTKLPRIDIELETAEMMAAISQIDTNQVQASISIFHA